MRGPHGHGGGRSTLYAAFAWAALRYWLAVFPRVASELRHWRRAAGRIADPHLRALAAAALAKQTNIEGAAAFATFVPGRARASAVRALVGFQALYNYADMLAEQPSEDPVGNARRVHQALLVALDPAGGGGGCGSDGRGDGDFLDELISVCETASGQLPSYGAVAGAALRAAARIVAFQSLSLGPPDELETWAREHGSEDAGYAWWELAAAAGSSLAVHALIAAAGTPGLPAEEVAAIESAYFPSIGALHSLLDSMLDVQEDAATGQLCLLDCYPSRDEAADGLARLAAAALKCARELPGETQHPLLVTAMACSYLAAPEAEARAVEPVARRALAALGPMARPMLLVFALRQLAGRARPFAAPFAAQARLAGASARAGEATRADDPRQSTDTACPDEARRATPPPNLDHPEPRGADARAA
jgi:tetraprenyl-beta-curcumene synthase